VSRPGRRISPVSSVAVVGRTVLTRPRLWGVGLRTALRLAPKGWWHEWPPLPLPDEAYWRFRLETAYGGNGEAPLREEDIVAYLQWCQRNRVPRG
jgi:hypothetical protein